jgi:sec-independent protein translocase protein TatC
MEEMTLEEHLTELRKRIIYTLIVLVLSLIVGFYYAGNVVEYLKADIGEGQNISLNVFSPAAGLILYMRISFIFGIIVTLPFSLYQLWRYLSPGLTSTERKIIVLTIPFVPLLFVLGILFAYFFIFPMLISFMVHFTNQVGVNEVFGITEYLRTMFNIIFPIGILFELPLVIFILTKLGILTPDYLAKIRKYAYLVFVLVSGLITPPDIISQILVSLPLILLFEISILLSRFIYKKRYSETDMTDIG